MREKSFKPRILIATLIVFFLTMGTVSANDGVITNAHNAAIEGLPQLLEASPLMKGLRSYGTVKADKSTGFQVFEINPQALAYGDIREDIIQSTPLYCFLVKQGEQVLGLTTVEKIDGQWEILTFGSAEMASQVNHIFKTYPANKGYTLRYLRSYQSFSDYFEISKDDDVLGIVPLTSGRIAMELKNKTFDAKEMFQQSEVFLGIGHHVLENLNNFSLTN